MSIRYLGVLAGAAFALMLQSIAAPSAGAQESTIGKWTFADRCAVCHGVGGQGDGPMADHFTPKPSNLTSLASQNDGVYPFGRVYQVIDGRNRTAGHGTSEMPIWGSHFKVEALPTAQILGVNEEEIVQGRILGLVYYIQTLQMK